MSTLYPSSRASRQTCSKRSGSLGLMPGMQKPSQNSRCSTSTLPKLRHSRSCSSVGSGRLARPDSSRGGKSWTMCSVACSSQSYSLGGKTLTSRLSPGSRWNLPPPWSWMRSRAGPGLVGN